MIKAVIIYIQQLLKRPLYILKHSKVPMSSRVLNGAMLISSEIGEYCFISKNCYLNHVKTGNYCSIAGTVTIGAMEHSYWAPSSSTHLSNECSDDKLTIIGNDVWIGDKVTIRQGLKIGDGAVIGAGSIVTKDVPENTIVCGVPAKFLKKRMPEDKWVMVKNSGYWNHNKRDAKIIIDKMVN